jgi:N-acetylneuraminic acid mutarotase
MRRSPVVVVMLLLVVGCGELVNRTGYVLLLTELCADVNKRIAEAIAPGTETAPPAVVANELRGLAADAREKPAPREDRDLLQRLLRSFDATAARFATAAAAGERGDEVVAAAELEAANASLEMTSELAIEYGMPPLDRCEDVIEGIMQSPSPDSSPKPDPSSPPPDGGSAPDLQSEAVPDPDTGTGWRQLEPARLARQEVATARVGGIIYVAGGITEHAATRRVEAFDPVLQTWSAAPDLPFPVHHAMAVELRGQLVVLGGWRPRGNDLNGVVSDQVHRLDGDVWRSLPPLRRPRAAAAAAVVDDQIVVVGGQTDGGGLVAETEIYDADSGAWRDAGDIPTLREHLAAASDGRHVYAVGGRELSSDHNLAALERYDLRTDAWDTLQPMVEARGSIGAAVVDGRLVVVGGESPTTVHGAVQAYDIAADRWAGLPDLPRPRHGAGVAAVGDVLYVIHGSDATTHVGSTAAVDVLDPPRRRREPTAWRDIVDARSARQQTAVAAVGGAIMVAGGLREGATATGSVTRLETTVDQWQPAPPLPRPLHHAMAVGYRGELVVLGGWVAHGSEAVAETSNTVYVLRDGRWQTLTPLNHARAAGAAAVVDDEIVVVGGQAGGTLVPQTEVYDGDADAWHDATDLPTPREHLAAAAHDGYLYAVGGRALTKDANYHVLERYDPRTDTWTRLSPMPSARGSMGAGVVEGRLVVAGGEGPTEVLDVVELYDIALRQWVEGPGLTTPRHGAGVAVVGPVMYLVGGATRLGHHDATATVEALDFE